MERKTTSKLEYLYLFQPELVLKYKAFLEVVPNL
jgi:hypothetical protein